VAFIKLLTQESKKWSYRIAW